MDRMTNRRETALWALGVTLLAQPVRSVAQSIGSALVGELQAKLFAVEFKTGPRWVASKQPHEQEHFREHSANLRKLREQGSLVLGARYGEKGLIVLAAESESAARAMIEQDPSVLNGVFSYELHPFLVFYGGAVQPPPRKP